LGVFGVEGGGDGRDLGDFGGEMGGNIVLKRIREHGKW
jgi:hypothetical protein